MIKKHFLSNWRVLYFFVLLLLAVTAVSCNGITIDLGDGTTISIGGDGSIHTTPPDTAVAGEWYDLYFTSPTCPDEEDRVGGIDEIIAEDLLTAQAQVDIAAFDLDSEPIVNALIELEDRGVNVRVVTDEDNGALRSINRLRRGGISVVEDERSALMHNKFIVIDGRYTWMGSMNYTTNGAYCNNNNHVRIDSAPLAANYLSEVAEMYDDESFGPRSPVNTPNERLTIGGVQVENYFGPETKMAPIIGNLVSEADSEILFMAFSFTSDIIGEPMFERAEAGIPVRGVFETTGSDTEFSYYGDFKDSGLPNVDVRQDGNPRIMHHKVIIIDRETVIFGSFNFSNNANDSNDENILIVHDPIFTGYFVEEFETVWNEAKSN